MRPAGMPPPGMRPPGPGAPPAGARPPAAAAPPAARRPPAPPAAAPRPAPPAPAPTFRPPPAPAPEAARARESFGLEPEAGAAPAAPSLDLDWSDLGGAQEKPTEARPPIELPAEEEPGKLELAPMHAFVPPPEAVGHKPEAPAPGEGGEAQLRQALSQASREVIEKIVWEVVPQLAEVIIREHVERLAKERQNQ